MQKITIKKILKKKGKEPIICLTSYTKTITEILDKHCDIILVGDSVGMVLYGMKTTRDVKVETMILHGKTVKNASNRIQFYIHHRLEREAQIIKAVKSGSLTIDEIVNYVYPKNLRSNLKNAAARNVHTHIRKLINERTVSETESTYRIV